MEALEHQIRLKVEFLTRVQRRNKVIHTLLLTWVMWTMYCQTYNWLTSQDVVRSCYRVDFYLRAVILNQNIF